MATYSSYAQKTLSEKLVLCWIEPTYRLLIFTVHSGSVYKKTVDKYIVNIHEGTTELTKGTSPTLSSGGR